MNSMEKKFQQFQSESPPVPRARVALRIRLVAALAVGTVGFLLYRLPGGFPPPTWVRLADLVRSHQVTLGPALLVSALQALALALAWVLLLYIALRVVRLWRFDPRLQLAQPPQALVPTARSEGEQGIMARQAAAPISGGEASHLQAAQRLPAAVHPTSQETSSVGTAVASSAQPQVTRILPRVEARWLERPTLLTLLTASAARSWGGSKQLPLDGSAILSPFLLTQEQSEGMSLAVSAGCQHAATPEVQAARESALFSAAGLYARPAPQESRACLLPLGLFLLSDGFAYRLDAGRVSTGQVTVQSGAQALLPLLAGSPSTHEPEAVGRRVLDGILHANATLYRRLVQAQVGEAERAVGTTLAALLVLGKSAYVASVGNSRVYLFRTSEGLVQVTYDHAPLPGAFGNQDGEVERAGEQDQAEPIAEVHVSPASNNRLFRSLGEQEQVEPDLFALQLEVGDLLLLCSDGLWNRVDRSTIEETLRRAALMPVADPHSTWLALCEHARAGGGSDPFCLIVVQTIGIKARASRRRGESEPDVSAALQRGAVSGQ
jgi:serine/threonine protein phosphatase PrpC